MKPKPTSSMQRATASGVEVDPRAERLEHVGRARQAGRRAVAVLGDRAARAGGDQRRGGRDVEGPAAAAGAGGVEQVLAADASTGAASARIVRARPASSSTVSPLVRSAIRKPAIWISVASPAMISASTAAVCSSLRSWPSASASIERVSSSGGAHRAPLQEVRQQLRALLGQHRLGVELDALGGQLAVADGHHDAAADGAALEHVGQRPGRRSASGSGRPRASLGQAAEDRAAVVLDHRSSCRGPARAGSPCRPTPGRAPGGRGRPRASGSAPPGSGAPPRG